MENFIIPDRKIIISLIRDDLTNYRLVSGLDSLGLESDYYYLYLSETIFALMGFEENKKTEKILEVYMELTEKVNRINMAEFNTQVDILAEEIYDKLFVKNSIK